ncbi:hypothetical protein Droror1_Dr00009178 [Drosera rotundifolia]
MLIISHKLSTNMKHASNLSPSNWSTCDTSQSHVRQTPSVSMFPKCDTKTQKLPKQSSVLKLNHHISKKHCRTIRTPQISDTDDDIKESPSVAVRDQGICFATINQPVREEADRI